MALRADHQGFVVRLSRQHSDPHTAAVALLVAVLEYLSSISLGPGTNGAGNKIITTFVSSKLTIRYKVRQLLQSND